MRTVQRVFFLTAMLLAAVGCSSGSSTSSDAVADSQSTSETSISSDAVADSQSTSEYSPNALTSLQVFPEPTRQFNDCEPEGDQSEYQWYRTDRTLTIDPRNPDRMLVAVERLGIYESLDGGVTWGPMSTTGLVWEMAGFDGTVCHKEMLEIRFDQYVPGRIYLFFGGTGTVEARIWQARGAGFYVSDDDGKTWTLLTTPDMNSYTASLAVDPFNPETIYAGVTASPLTSTEADPDETFVDVGMVYKITGVGQGGTSHEELPTGWGKATSANTLWADPSVPDRLILGVFAYQGRDAPAGTGLEAGWYETLDGGTTWDSMGTGVGHGLPVVNAAISTDGTHIINTTQSETEEATFVSADGGRTWTRLADRVVAAMFDGRGDGRRAFAVLDTPLRDGPNTLVRSDDGGLSWTPIGKLPPEFATNAYNEEPIKRRAVPSKIVVHPDRPEIMYVSGAGGLIARSTDAGATWTLLTTWESFERFAFEAR